MRRGEVWLINLDPTLGAEMQKLRPAVIVSSDAVGALPLKVIVPLTDWKEHYAIAPWMVHIEPTLSNGLVKASAADAFQVRSVSQGRFTRKIGELASTEMRAIASALGIVLEVQ